MVLTWNMPSTVDIPAIAEEQLEKFGGLNANNDARHERCVGDRVVNEVKLDDKPDLQK